jgi:hypothetical protein
MQVLQHHSEGGVAEEALALCWIVALCWIAYGEVTQR